MSVIFDAEPVKVDVAESAHYLSRRITPRLGASVFYFGKCLSSIILSPPNSNVKMSPHERKDIRVESEGTATSERNFQLR